MITLGMMDEDVQQEQIDAYFDKVKKITRFDWRNKGLKHEKKNDFRKFKKFIPDKTREIPELEIKKVQTILKNAGFFPNGKADGICGYSTLSAIRLFQEYIRSIEGNSEITPDGLAGNTTFKSLKAWEDADRKADWTDTINAWQAWVDNGNTIPQSVDTEYAKWLRFLDKVKEHYLQTPNAMLQEVNKFPHTSTVDTLKVADWDFSPGYIHLIGVRRKSSGDTATFNDILVLLINGMVFKFLGSTDPGSTVNPAGFPFLVQGQHKYHFGWHNLSQPAKTHQALKPIHADVNQGVLVVRAIPPGMEAGFEKLRQAIRNNLRPLPRQFFSARNFGITQNELAKGLKPNHTINIHWAGAGLDSNTKGAKVVGTWSDGCQVITGAGYINHHNQSVDCSRFAAAGNDDVGTQANNIIKTRGAYNVLLDLVAAFGSNRGEEVRYMLLIEEDIARDAEITGILQDARTKSGIKI